MRPFSLMTVTSTKFIAGLPMKPATNRFDGSVVEVLRRVELLEHAVAHDRDAVAHRHGLDLVVGHVDGGGLQALVQLARSRRGSATRSLASRFESGSSMRNTAARGRWRGRARRAGAGRRRAAWACDRAGSVSSSGAAASSTRRSISALGTLRSFRPKAMLSCTRHVRVERVALEHHGDVAVLGRDVVDDAVADAAASPPVISSSPAIMRSAVRLAAARRADKAHGTRRPGYSRLRSLTAITSPYS